MFGNSALREELKRVEGRFDLTQANYFEREKQRDQELVELEKQIKKLKKHLKQVDATLLPYKDPQPRSFFGNIPIAVSEQEEDAKFQLDAGLIDVREYEEILADAGLDPNIEIQL